VAGVQRDADPRLRHNRRVGVVGDTDGQRAAGVAGLQRAQHVGRGAGGGQQQDHVVGLRCQRQQVGAALFAVVFRALHGLEHGALAACQQRQCAFVRPRKGRIQLDAVQHPEPAGGAGAHVDQTPAGGDARRRRFHCGGDGGGGILYRLYRVELVRDQRIDQVGHRILIQASVFLAGEFGIEHRMPVGIRYHQCNPQACRTLMNACRVGIPKSYTARAGFHWRAMVAHSILCLLMTQRHR
jgi:hypothetical protein